MHTVNLVNPVDCRQAHAFHVRWLWLIAAMLVAASHFLPHTVACIPGQHSCRQLGPLICSGLAWCHCMLYHVFSWNEQERKLLGSHLHDQHHGHSTAQGQAIQVLNWTSAVARTPSSTTTAVLVGSAARTWPGLGITQRPTCTAGSVSMQEACSAIHRAARPVA